MVVDALGLLHAVLTTGAHVNDTKAGWNYLKSAKPYNGLRFKYIQEHFSIPSKPMSGKA